MLPLVRAYISQHRLLSGDKRVVVGLSGGGDSVALLAALVRLGYTCVAAHCNFHLRAEESDREEAFAGNFAQRLQLPFYKADFDTRQYASLKHISIEMAARELRYAWFEDLRQSIDAEAIAVAHHKDDSVETFLINLTRGSGIRGLRGIQPKNGYIVRPLLAVGKKEILSWLEEQQLTYMTDSSNFSEIYTRNVVRHKLIPLLEEMNPSVKEAIARTAGHLSEVERIYQSVVEKARRLAMKDGHRISIEELRQFPAPQTILYELLLPFHFSRFVTDDIFSALDKESGKTFYSPTHRLIKDRTCLLITPIEENGSDRSYEIETERESWSNGAVNLLFRKVKADELQIEKDKSIAYFDYDKLSFPLSLRAWKAGDRFVPFGMKGWKKLSDYFSDRKYSLQEKEEAWLLCSGEDIIWIVNERPDERFRVNKTTKYILAVKFLGKMPYNI
jgi:tRNA(Ile)-lysidine synthase